LECVNIIKNNPNFDLKCVVWLRKWAPFKSRIFAIEEVYTKYKSA
jgi:hypothetical protein